MKRTLVLLFLALFMLSGCKSNKEATTPTLTPVEVQVAQRGDLVVTYKASGTVQPIKEVSISSKVTGRVEHVNKNIGDPVKANELLYSIEKTDIQNQLNSSRSQANQTLAGVDVAIAANKSASANADQQLMQAESALSSANSALEKAQIAFDSAEKDYNNNKILYDSGAISKNALELYKTGLDTAQSNLSSAKISAQSAQKSYELTKNSINPSTKNSSQAQIKQAQAAAAASQSQISSAIQMINDSNVKSPINGFVSFKNAEVGQMAPQGSAAYTIVDISKVTVDVEVSEKYINSIKLGSIAKVNISSISDKQFDGTVVTVSPAPMAQKAGYLVRVLIDNPDSTIKAGMFANASFDIGLKQNVVKVPLNALKKADGKNIIFTLDNDTVKYHEVEIGEDDGTNVEVLNNIQEGMQIVVKGQQFVADGEKVQVVNP